MKKFTCLMIYLYYISFVFGQKTTNLLYLHGSYTDSDWEQLEFIVPPGAEKADIYYDYAGSKKGKIKLEKKERLEIGGNIIIKVEFPVILKIYYITVSQDYKTLKMTDEKGTYEKDFYRIKSSSETANISTDYQSQIKVAFNNYVKTNPDYCSEADCDKAHQDLMNGKEMRCSIGIENGSITYVYGDINQDGQMDALVNFGLIQCDGGNALCGSGGEALVLSGLSSYKVIEPKFEDGDNEIRHNLEKINTDGTIISNDQYWAEDDPRCIPSLSKKAKYKLSYNTLSKTY